MKTEILPICYQWKESSLSGLSGREEVFEGDSLEYFSLEALSVQLLGNFLS